MRILRGLSSRVLECGCLVGVYETYDGEVVTILDVKGPACAVRAHHGDEPVSLDTVNDVPMPHRTSSIQRDNRR